MIKKTVLMHYISLLIREAFRKFERGRIEILNVFFIEGRVEKVTPSMENYTKEKNN